VKEDFYMFPLIYTNKEILFLRNKIIQEYDISSGGYSCSLNHNLLSSEEKSILINLTKKEKQIFLGNKALQEKNFTKKLHEAFRYEINLFIEKNEINPNNILSIKKDSITLYDSKIINCNNKNVKFTLRKEFTSYLLLNKLEFYYNIYSDDFLVKGIAKDFVKENTLLEEIQSILKIKSYKQDDSIFEYLKNIRENYLSKSLINSYYREINNIGKYKLKEKLKGSIMYIDNILDDEIDSIDISYNYLNILLPLFKIFC
jgi:hypothetical protein